MLQTTQPIKAVTKMPNSKLKDNAIKKALEGAILNAKKCDSKVWSIEVYKLENALDLINRQEEEKQNLVADIERLREIRDLCNTTILEQKEQIEKLKISDASKEECTIKQHGEIKELKAEVERLKIENGVLMKQILAENKTNATAIMAETKQHMMTAEKIKRLREEIDKLQIAQFQFISEINAYKGKLKTAKTEAYKEFAERLKEKGYFPRLSITKVVSIEDIDKLLKEMVSDNNA